MSIHGKNLNFTDITTLKTESIKPILMQDRFKGMI